jgi:hypothetical protein
MTCFKDIFKEKVATAGIECAQFAIEYRAIRAALWI